MSANKLNWCVIGVLLALIISIILVVAVRAQQPPTALTAPAALANSAVALTPAERADIESLQKDMSLADAQFQLLQYKLKELQASYQQTAAAMSQRLAVARRDHKLDDSYNFDQAGMQFVKRAADTPVPSKAPAPAMPK